VPLDFIGAVRVGLVCHQLTKPNRWSQINMKTYEVNATLSFYVGAESKEKAKELIRAYLATIDFDFSDNVSYPRKDIEAEEVATVSA
jgi:hypothetical protein